MICSVVPSENVDTVDTIDTNFSLLETTNESHQFNFVEDNHSITLTIDKSAEVEMSRSDMRNSADELPNSEMLLKLNLVSSGQRMSLSLPEMVGRREKLL